MKRGQCATVLTMGDLSPNDRAEVEKFKAWLGVEASRKAGGDPAMLNVVEAAIYPDGRIVRTPPDGSPDA